MVPSIRLYFNPERLDISWKWRRSYLSFAATEFTLNNARRLRCADVDIDANQSRYLARRTLSLPELKGLVLLHGRIRISELTEILQSIGTRLQSLDTDLRDHNECQQQVGMRARVSSLRTSETNYR